ncbi:MAG: 5-oxoprolinase, partial [Nitrospinae bacterium]|nr:5-oxoprolinase [Nitrospinota bacterium]
MADSEKFRFSIDRGGTFTDIYAETPEGPRILKLLSENPTHYSDASVEGIRRIIREVTGKTYTPDSIEWIRMGTTVATNALLERKGARTALIISKGFGDLLRIGKQNRPNIFDLKIALKEPLYEKVLEIDERVIPERESSPSSVKILQAPDLETIRRQLQELSNQGIESIAIALMHSYIFPDHERLISSEAKKYGFKNISLSSDAMPRARLVDRGNTACLDAYLNPHIHHYLKNFIEECVKQDLFLMQSDGGLVEADSFTGSRAILSGPAGGVVGYARTTGETPVIGFDMGGTSTDVSRFDGSYEWQFESETEGIPNLVPQLNIHTVAAGGGSRLLFENGMFQVGPSSSGAWPGPVCYGNGGPLSLTDANLVLGRLVPRYFPSVFGENEDQPLSKSDAEKAFRELMQDICSSTGKTRSLEEVAYGFVEVANENMARAIHEITGARGHDVRDHVLSCFGGAGGQHACALARTLGISRVFISRFAGVLSAYGMALADVVVDKEEPVSHESRDELDSKLQSLEEKAVAELKQKGNFSISIQRYLNMRYEGSDTTFLVEESGDVVASFEKMHQREFGFNPHKREILIEAIRVRAEGKSPAPLQTPLAETDASPAPDTHQPCYFAGGWRDTPVYDLQSLKAGQELKGP